MKYKRFSDFISEELKIQDKKWTPPVIDGYTIEYNNVAGHEFRTRIDKIEEFYKHLDKPKYQWLKEMSRVQIIKNLQEKVEKGIYKIIDKAYIGKQMITVYFSKSKFMAIYLVNDNYIRLSTISTIDMKVSHTIKTTINESDSIDIVLEI